MTQNKTQVVFTKTHAIVLENNSRKLKHGYAVLTNPNFLVGETPNKYWKIGKNNSVTPMNPFEMIERDKAIDALGIDTDCDILQPVTEKGAPATKPVILRLTNPYFAPIKADKVPEKTQNKLDLINFIQLLVLVGVLLALVFKR